MYTSDYTRKAKSAIKDQVLQTALVNLQEKFGKGAQRGYQAFPEGPDLRLKAHTIREKTIENLDIILAVLSNNIRKNMGHVHFAANAQEATQHCLDIAKQHDVKLAVKGKSMLSEEIGLNKALMAANIETVETDLGECIIQLAGEGPSHIIAPAVHKTRQEIGHLFEEKLGIPYSEDPPTLTLAARKALRKKFLKADMGVSGCNLACAETGHITTVSNEGNIRMVSSLPRVHVAIMGMERVVADLRDHEILFRLLSMGGAAQSIAGYISYRGGLGQEGHLAGPKEFHLIIVDNGRSKILADPQFREMLYCIRCGACLNICPVYGHIGGHAYKSAYSGPVGAVVTPLLKGINQHADLCLGESLCGACMDTCPVNINIPRMLLLLRHKLAEGDRNWNVKIKNRVEQKGFDLWALLISNPGLYDLFLKSAYVCQKFLPGNDHMISRLPFNGKNWSQSRDLKRLSGQRFLKRMSKKEER